MFLFKKNKPFLQDLIPNDFVDIHSHLLPAIDDGSKNIEESIKLLTNLKLLGMNEFIFTPHIYNEVWNNTLNIIEDNFNNSKTAFLKAAINNNCKAAAEYMMDGYFNNLIKNENLVTLKDNYVLVEMSYINAPLQLYDIIFDMHIAGYIPVLAHPERYSFYHSNLNEYKKLKKAGCKFQLNLLSTVGYYGPEVTATADYLLKNNMIDFLGSDVHHYKHIESLRKRIVLKNCDFLNPIFLNNSFFKM